MLAKVLRITLPAVLLGGCATSSQLADSGPTPEQVVASGEAGTAVHWGGQIIMLRNLRDRTLVEVLALPLDSSGRLQQSGKPQGRFMVEKVGFLEPHEYAPDRLLEVRGQLRGFSNGLVGEAAYRYPVVVGDQLVLWPDPGQAPSTAPRVNFGLGIGNYGGGVGVGIGF